MAKKYGKKKSTARKIFVITGGTGRTASYVLSAALAQFERPGVEIVKKVDVLTVKQAVQVVRQAAKAGALVIHTLVDPEVRDAVHEELLHHNVPNVDLLRPVIALLSDELGIEPKGQPGLFYQLGKEQFDRTDAVDFTLAHDDGQRLDDLHLADVTLVGISRVSKSVTCFYLAARGIRAANVPITKSRTILEKLADLDPQRVIGLKMNAARLCSIRQARLDRIAGETEVASYAEKREIASEINDALKMFNKNGWRTVDVSYKATEEVASEIISMLPGRS
jgi:regulator of PEP synthase PpsR (kinase-PPPase family)